MPFIFGYGSLLNLCNHNINDNLYYVKLIPSVNFSVRRSFNAQSEKSSCIPNAYTALGIEYVDDIEKTQPINGIIFEVDEIKLLKLIEREKNYKIVELELSLFDFIKSSDYVKFIDYFDSNKDEISRKIITFVPIKTEYESITYPLNKKYIQICLDGFLAVDKTFAYNFIETTYGWSDEVLEYAHNYINANKCE